MNAVLISYSTKGLSKTESSKISKRLIGYIDKSNKGGYTYVRKGLISSLGGIVIARSTFIIPQEKIKEILSFISSKKLSINSWNIEIPRKYFKN